jgi:hypothetical protein
MNSNRDPIDSDILAQAVSTWLGSDPGDEEANQALVAVMLAQGVLSPEEASEALVSDECETPRVIVEIHDGVTLVIVDDYGHVTTMRG